MKTKTPKTKTPAKPAYWRTPRREQGQISQTHVPQYAGSAEGDGPRVDLMMLVTDQSDRTWALYARPTREEEWAVLSTGSGDGPSVEEAMATSDAAYGAP